MKWTLLLMAMTVAGEEVKLGGLRQPVEVLRDRWGVPHIYAKTTQDLFFAQGYMAARDRLFQLDLWRRINSGHLAEVNGRGSLERDRIARLVRYRGDWKQEWTAYSSDAQEIVTAFVGGINAYIESLKGEWPMEFRLAGYGPGKWVPEDCVARVAGLLMTRNLAKEVERAIDVREHGLAMVERVKPPDPLVRLAVPAGLDLKVLDHEILSGFSAATGGARVNADQGSNNWVVDGTRTMTGKPLLASDPHRPINIPSLRKTVHLVGPGWNAFGAGEPALPGIALGHNEDVGFGFTIVGIDQCDLYVERVNPSNPNEYWYRGAWKPMVVETQKVAVKGEGMVTVTLKYTVHGPVLYENARERRAFALKWVGAEPGGAGYLAALGLARAKNWGQFLKALESYKVPSENLVYADRQGNIGWVASGLTPVRKGWDGLFPVPGDSGDYEWQGYLKLSEHPQEYNPGRHWIATANHNILPAGYRHRLSFEWAQPFRYERVAQMLGGSGKFSVGDFERMQQDVTNVAAQRFQGVLKRHVGAARGEMKGVYERMLKWDARMSVESVEATLFAVWMARLPEFLFETPIAGRAETGTVLKALEKEKDDRALRQGWERARMELERGLGKDMARWKWGELHTLSFTHPLRTRGQQGKLDRGPMGRPGDGNTVNAASGNNFKQTNGASYRQILDVADWDKSVMTNVPGEVGNPESRHYSDLLEDWLAGRYHPMVYTRGAVERATVERVQLVPR